jgi:hypothetical protein|tara:strand:+ start:181 stop:324 length:144 start_codon:yes stop_codon:yes gene_type:complete
MGRGLFGNLFHIELLDLGNEFGQIMLTRSIGLGEQPDAAAKSRDRSD